MSESAGGWAIVLSFMRLDLESLFTRVDLLIYLVGLNSQVMKERLESLCICGNRMGGWMILQTKVIGANQVLELVWCVDLQKRD